MQERQCICVHVGQCGIQTGNSIWELFCIEHGIRPDGTVIDDDHTGNLLASSQTFFLNSENQKMIPRAVMVDLEPTVLDEIRVGPYKDLFNHNQLISGKEDSAINYARGHYSVGKGILETVYSTIKKVEEQCDSLQGFIIIHSGGGGTGSGFGTLLMETIVTEYPKKSRMEVIVYPAPHVASSVVEPYNSVLSTHGALACDYSDCTFTADNEALFDVCQNKLCIDRPGFTSLNRVLAQVVSSITASLRFNGLLNVDLPEFHMNLVPFPRLHFPVTSYAPIIGTKELFHKQLSVPEITSECFEKMNQLVKCDLKSGSFIACCLLYRGDVVPKDINSAINIIKSRRNINFVEWCPTGFKIGINCQPPSSFPGEKFTKLQRAVCMMGNTTAIVEPWDRIGKKFDIMFHKKAFIHWFLTEGMDEDQFVESRTDVEMLQLDYLEVQNELDPQMEDYEI